MNEVRTSSSIFLSALSVLDATGKGINGLFQGTLSSPGAYDECLETVIYDEDSGEETLRGQYCNVYLKSFGSFVHHIRNSTALSHPRVSHNIYRRKIDISINLIQKGERKEDKTIQN